MNSDLLISTFIVITPLFILGASKGPPHLKSVEKSVAINRVRIIYGLEGYPGKRLTCSNDSEERLRKSQAFHQGSWHGVSC